MPQSSFSSLVTFSPKTNPPPNSLCGVRFTSSFNTGKPLAAFSSKINLGPRATGDSGDLLAGRYRE